jgi:hypothetical protein
LNYNGPFPETYPCSQELFQRLQAEARDGFISIRCRINGDGVAVPAEARTSGSQS